MKKLLLTIVTVATMLFNINKSYADIGNLDQSNELANDNTGTVMYSGDVAQSFTCGISGELSGIAVNLLSPATSGVTVSIYAGNGTMGATLLSAFPANLSGAGWNTIVLPPGINLTSGSVYTFFIESAFNELLLIILCQIRAIMQEDYIMIMGLLVQI